VAAAMVIGRAIGNMAYFTKSLGATASVWWFATTLPARMGHRHWEVPQLTVYR
jgi:hypothetical protein